MNALMLRSDVVATLDALGPIDLVELTLEAALQTRVDRKYALHRDDARRVLGALASSFADGPRPRVLEIDGTRALGYESLYFDTPALASYRLAAHGRRRRFKLRTRSYLDTGSVFLEMKTRGARSATVKERVPYRPGADGELDAAGREYAAESLDGLGLRDVDPGDLHPVLATRYRRTTLHLPGSGSRATVDESLLWEGADGRVLRRPELVIVETKSGGAASELDRLLWRHGHRPARLSKFGTGLAALRPDLPSTKWRRVLRTHFA